MKTYTAATFNGNVVVGTGETLHEAKEDAENKAKELGSCIRKAIASDKFNNQQKRDAEYRQKWQSIYDNDMQDLY